MLVRFLDFNINYFRKSILFFCNKKSWKRSRTREKSSPRLWCTGWTTRYHPVHHSGGELLSRVLERFQDFFDFEKKIMFFRKNILKYKICSGIRKSHLENCTSILKIPNRKNRLFFLITLQIRLYSIPGWRILCTVRSRGNGIPFCSWVQAFLLQIPISSNSHKLAKS